MLRPFRLAFISGPRNPVSPRGLRPGNCQRKRAVTLISSVLLAATGTADGNDTLNLIASERLGTERALSALLMLPRSAASSTGSAARCAYRAVF